MVVIEDNVSFDDSPSQKPGSRFIVMIDDDPLSNFLSKKVLRHFGALAPIKTFIHALNALQYIESLNSVENDIDEICILLDLQMIGMDGLDFLQNLRKVKLNVKIRIYLLTGSMPVTRLNQLKSFSFAGFFLKPLSKGNVKEVLMPLNPVYFN